MSLSLYNYSDPNKVKHAWEHITYKFEEMISTIGVRHSDGTYYTCYQGKCPYNGVFQVHDLHTIHRGKCYTLEFFPNITFSSLDNVMITYQSETLFFAHGRGQEIGFIANFFPLQPEVFHLKDKQTYHVSFEPMETITEQYLGCDESVNETDFYECAKLALAKEMVAKGVECTLPMISNILPTKDLPYCPNNLTAVKVLNQARDTFRALTGMNIDRTICSLPCQKSQYNFDPLMSRTTEDEENYIYFAINSNQVLVAEQVRIFDLNSIIGTVGGSLGLFIGFSFLACIQDIFNFSCKVCKHSS